MEKAIEKGVTVDAKNPRVVMSLQEDSKFPLLEIRQIAPGYTCNEALFFMQYYDTHYFCSQHSGFESFGIKFRVNSDNLVIKPMSESHHKFDDKKFFIYEAEFLVENNKLIVRAETGSWAESHSISARFEIAGRSILFKDKNAELEIIAKKDSLLILPLKRS
jgi:hypothetical protein